MAKVVDISKYMCADAPQIVMFGKTYTVKNDHKTMLLLADLQAKKADKDMDNKIFKLLLGEDAQTLIDALESMPNYAENEKAAMLNVLALATGVEVATLEARFQQSIR